MASLESSLWSWLERAGKKFSRLECQMTRIENSATSGTPDVEGIFKRVQFWIELKVSVRPKQGGAVDVKHLRSKQAQWLHNRWLAGGNAWILLRVDGRGGSAHYLLPGKYSRQLLAGMTEAEIAEASVVTREASSVAVLRTAAMDL